MKAGWEVKTLGDVCDLQNGYAFKSTDYIDISNTLNIRMSSIRPDGSFDAEYNQRFLPDSYAIEYKSFLLDDEDLIIAMTDMAGDPKILGVPTLVANKNGRNFLMNQRVGKLFGFSKEIHVPYLRYFLTSPKTKEMYKSKGAGGLQINISKADVLSVHVPFPNITEQQRIVAILDQAFEGIAKARANAEQNLQNARTLFESHLQLVFTQRGKEWVDRKLEDICQKITDGTHHSPQTQFPEPGPDRFPYITSKNIRNNCMDLSKISYIEKAFHDTVYARCQPQLGDVLLTKDGANTGNVTLNTLNEPFSLLSSVCLIKTNQTILKPAFLCYYLQSTIGLSSIIGQMSGAAIKRIVLKDIKKAVIPFPSINAQNRITETFNLLLTETQRLEALYQRKVALLDELKKSLLQQAFAGEL
jgi:type I restriction enzyme S subunit